MIELIKPCTTEQYAEFARQCNDADFVITDAGDRYIGDYPKYSDEELKAIIRAARDNLFAGIVWRTDRYRNQSEAGLPTTDDKATYQEILHYLQYLRDYPDQKAKWWENTPLSFEEWEKRKG